MKNKFHELLKYDDQNSRIRKFGFTSVGLTLVSDLKKRSVELLCSMLQKVPQGNNEEDFYLNLHYAEVGFKDRSNYYKYLRDLESKRFIIKTDKGYLINFILVDYLSKRQRNYFRSKYGLTKTIVPFFGNKK